MLKKNIRKKGKISIRSYLKKVQKGDKVCLLAESAVQKGMYFPRFHGKVGVIDDQAGNCYKVNIKDIKKQKTLIVHPVHLRKI